RSCLAQRRAEETPGAGAAGRASLRAPRCAILRIIRSSSDALVAIDLVAVQAHVREPFGNVAHLFLAPRLRGGIDGLRGFVQLVREPDPIRIVHRHGLAVFAAASW